MDDRSMRLERESLRACRCTLQAGFGACESGWCNRKRRDCIVGRRQGFGSGEVWSGNKAGSELYIVI